MDSIVRRVAESQTQLSDFYFHFLHPSAWRWIPKSDAKLNSESFCSSDFRSHLPLTLISLK